MKMILNSVNSNLITLHYNTHQTNKTMTNHNCKLKPLAADTISFGRCAAANELLKADEYGKTPLHRAIVETYFDHTNKSKNATYSITKIQNVLDKARECGVLGEVLVSKNTQGKIQAPLSFAMQHSLGEYYGDNPMVETLVHAGREAGVLKEMLLESDAINTAARDKNSSNLRYVINLAEEYDILGELLLSKDIVSKGNVLHNASLNKENLDLLKDKASQFGILNKLSLENDSLGFTPSDYLHTSVRVNPYR